MTLAPFDLREAIIQAAEMTHFKATEKRVRLEVSPSASPVNMAGDFHRILQVLINLLNNAIKFTDPGGRVYIAVSTEGEEAVVRVVDSGIGIPPDQLSSIFELFSQAHTSAPSGEFGLGLGLALTRDLVSLHGGAIEARSEGLGKGSEFTVRVPLLMLSAEEQ